MDADAVAVAVAAMERYRVDITRPEPLAVLTLSHDRSASSVMRSARPQPVRLHLIVYDSK